MGVANLPEKRETCMHGLKRAEATVYPVPPILD
jgi:hypothetical protein